MSRALGSSREVSSGVPTETKKEKELVHKHTTSKAEAGKDGKKGGKSEKRRERRPREPGFRKEQHSN